MPFDVSTLPPLPPLPSEYYTSHAPELRDPDAIWSFLHNDAYWSKDRPREKLERQIKQSWMCMGLYERDGSRDGKGKQVGFARVVGDGEQYAYLCDVFIIKSHQNKGLGRQLINATLNQEGRDKWVWMLHSGGAEGWYDKYFGFVQVGAKYAARERGF